jgi:hypothetical protein
MKLSKDKKPQEIKSDRLVCPRCRSQFAKKELKHGICTSCGSNKIKRLVEFERTQPARKVARKSMGPIGAVSKPHDPDELIRTRRGLKNGI